MCSPLDDTHWSSSACEARNPPIPGYEGNREVGWMSWSALCFRPGRAQRQEKGNERTHRDGTSDELGETSKDDNSSVSETGETWQKEERHVSLR